MNTNELKSFFFYRVTAAYKGYLGVKGTEALQSQRDIAAAAEAAKVLYHFREHFPPEHRKSGNEVTQLCPDYALLRDVADADKHGSLNDKTRAVSDISQIVELIACTQYEDELGPYRHAEKAVWLNLTDGSTRDVLEVLTNVVNCWIDLLHSIGVIDNLQRYVSATVRQPIPRDKYNYSHMGIEVMQGLDHKLRFAEQRYNYANQKVEPVDLTGVPLEFNIYKPSCGVEISLTNNVTGQKLTRTVTFDDNLEEFQKLGTDKKGMNAL